MANAREPLKNTRAVRKLFHPLLLLLAFGAPIGPLLAGWVGSVSQEPQPSAQAEAEHGPFRVLSEQETARIPESERKLLTLVDDVLLVDTGTPDDATTYYGKLAGKLPGLDKKKCLDTKLLGCSIPDLLAYFGYGPLLPKDLQKLRPEVLMDYSSLLEEVSNPQDFKGFPPIAKDEILVTRFFAPKIVSVKTLPAGELGWRKVLYFKARPGSGADKDQLAEFYLLFNFGSTDPKTKFPEGKDAAQIQAMATPKYPKNAHYAAYFFVFNPLSGKCPEADANGNIVVKDCKPAQIGLHLTASFDANGLPQKNYYVPIACAQCHGAVEYGADGSKDARINYLDTDHWYDKVQPGADFSEVKEEDVLVGGGGKAMRTIYQINSRIRAQNSAIDGSAESFQTRAVDKWLALHADCKDQPAQCKNEHFPPLSRGFKRPGSATVWSAGNDNDTKLLPLLNQNCFRCHSSFKFHVFEKKTIYDKRESLKIRLKGSMPPDRKLADPTKQDFIKRLDAMTE